MNKYFFFQAEDGIRDGTVTGVQTCALPICDLHRSAMRTNPKGVEVYGPRAVRCRSRHGLMGGHQPFLLEREEDVFTSEASFGALDRELRTRIHVLRRRPLRPTTRLCPSIAERFTADADVAPTG